MQFIIKMKSSDNERAAKMSPFVTSIVNASGVIRIMLGRYPTADLRLNAAET
jgi:hypothetical protein